MHRGRQHSSSTPKNTSSAILQPSSSSDACVWGSVGWYTCTLSLVSVVDNCCASTNVTSEMRRILSDPMQYALLPRAMRAVPSPEGPHVLPYELYTSHSVLVYPYTTTECSGGSPAADVLGQVVSEVSPSEKAVWLPMLSRATVGPLETICASRASVAGVATYTPGALCTMRGYTSNSSMRTLPVQAEHWPSVPVYG